MGRLARFEDYRFIGVRGAMTLIDCDDPDEFEELETLVQERDLVNANLLQSFSPDTREEASNRGYQPSSRP